jgi:Mn-dependent DtxR family transcriptional regulator
MGQQEIYDFLKKCRSRWYTSKEISNKLNVSVGSVTNALKKLRYSNLLHFKKDDYSKNTFLYKFKR